MTAVVTAVSNGERRDVVRELLRLSDSLCSSAQLQLHVMVEQYSDLNAQVIETPKYTLQLERALVSSARWLHTPPSTTEDAHQNITAVVIVDVAHTNTHRYDNVTNG
jgi:hypothetical protein